MIDKHLTKLRLRDDINAEEERAIRETIGGAVDYPAGHVLIPRGKEIDNSTLLLDGLLARYKDLRGGQRQITQLHVPGDFADLHSFTLKKLDHSVMALTRVRVALAPHEKLKRITEQFPHLTRVFWFATNLDAAIHREWELSLGRRSAIQRAAHLFCELRVRLGIVGLADDSGFALRITQLELAECLGLTSVHVNRVMRQLREQGIADFRGGRVNILSWGALQEIGEFDPLYLYLEKRPR